MLPEPVNEPENEPVNTIENAPEKRIRKCLDFF